MTYKEAIELSITVEWKTSLCSQGEQCWCRIIEPNPAIEDKDGNEIYIAGMGCVSEIFANHIVELHNQSIKAQ